MAGYDSFSSVAQPQGSGYDAFSTAAPLVGPRTFRKDEDEDLYQQTLARLKDERSKPRVPRSGYQEGTPEEEAVKEVQRLRGAEAEQAAFDQSRTSGARVADTATFIVSAPVRALTRGEYGIGDVVGQVSQGAGEALTQGEQDFARANQWWLEPVAQAGEAAIAIPALQSMGGVPGQVLRQAAHAVNRYTPTRMMTPSPPAVATPAQAYGPAERIIDRQAFVDEGIPEFAPAFGSKGLARSARTIEETPFVGGTVKVPKIGVEQAMAARQTQLARQAGPELSQEGVGDVVQHGLRRFRGSDLQDLERTRVQALGLTPDRPPQRNAGSVNINRPSQLNTAGMSAAELDAAAASRVDLPGSTRSRVENLSPTEVQRIISMPARETSFATKASALYRQAEDALPRLMRVNDTANPSLLATRNAQRVVGGMLRQEEAASISGGILEGRFGDLVQRLANPRSNFTLDALRAARTEVGRALSNFGDFDVRLDRTQLKQLYGAVSDDYQSGLVALAARARRLSRLQPGDQGYVPDATAQVADAADRALHRYRVADRYFRQGIERMDRFMGALGANTLEQAAQRVGRYLRENTQDIRALESMGSALRPEEWRAVLGNVVEGLGRFTPGAREAERIFSFERYATDWNKISQNPRVLALFRRSLGNDVVRSLQNLGRVAERMKYYETTKNYSGSAYSAGAGAGLALLYDPTLWPALLGAGAGFGATGKVLTSRSFARWVNSVNRAQVRVGSSLAATRQALQPHIQRLRQFATKEPDPEVATAMAGLAYLIDQQLAANENPR